MGWFSEYTEAQSNKMCIIEKNYRNNRKKPIVQSSLEFDGESGLFARNQKSHSRFEKKPALAFLIRSDQHVCFDSEDPMSMPDWYRPIYLKRYESKRSTK